MDATNVASLVVAVIAALTAIASQRSASRASVVNARTAAEEEAYNRARKMDTDTIDRLDRENKELRERLDKETREFREREEDLEEQVEILRWKVRRLEQGLPPMKHPMEEKNDKPGPEG
jgi:predicted RNase H-like nuclease (RuvC/YqgF family)